MFFFNTDLRIADVVNQKYSTSHCEQLKAIKDKLDEDTQIQTALKTCSAAQQTGAALTTGTAPRTTASPAWGNEPPMNFRKRIQANSLPISDFDSAHTLLVFGH